MISIRRDIRIANTQIINQLRSDASHTSVEWRRRFFQGRYTLLSVIFRMRRTYTRIQTNHDRTYERV